MDTMSKTAETAKEALRILRRVETIFNDNSRMAGSGFVGPEAGIVMTSAHIVHERGKVAGQITVEGRAAQIQSLHEDIDLAILSTSESETSQLGDSSILEIGDQVMFAGYPIGVLGPSVFSGMLSAHGERLIQHPRCRVLQIGGMINLGNSGGPLLPVGSQEVVGVITAKFVPLLREIDKLRDILRQIRQLPTGQVGISGVDFSKFFNLTMQALLTVSGSLRLVQVGTGYAVPIDLWKR